MLVSSMCGLLPYCNITYSTLFLYFMSLFLLFILDFFHFHSKVPCLPLFSSSLGAQSSFMFYRYILLLAVFLLICLSSLSPLTTHIISFLLSSLHICKKDLFLSPSHQSYHTSDRNLVSPASFFYLLGSNFCFLMSKPLLLTHDHTLP